MSEEKRGCLPAGCGTILVGLMVTGAVLAMLGGRRASAPPDPAYSDYYAKHTSQPPAPPPPDGAGCKSLLDRHILDCCTLHLGYSCTGTTIIPYTHLPKVTGCAIDRLPDRCQTGPLR